jgi:hypothetical protein
MIELAVFEELNVDAVDVLPLGRPSGRCEERLVKRGAAIRAQGLLHGPEVGAIGHQAIFEGSAGGGWIVAGGRSRSGR